MTIKQNGGVFGRNPTFNDVTIEGQLTFDGDIDINSDLTVDGNLDVTGIAKVNSFIAGATSTPQANAEIKDATGGELRLSTSEASMVANDVAGKITWNAPNEGSGTPANIVAGEISLIATNFWDSTKYTPSAMVFKTTPLNGPAMVEAARFTSDGNLAFPSGQGIDFSATSGTGTSELFSDYEEGVWTPTYAITGGSFSAITYNTYTGGVYTKVGNVVYVSGYITTNSASVSVDGGLTIEGLPFATGSGTGLSTRSAVTIGEVVAFGTNYPTSGRFQAGTSRIYLTERSSANGASTFLQASNMGNTTQDNQISFSGFYMI